MSIVGITRYQTEITHIQQFTLLGTSWALGLFSILHVLDYSAENISIYLILCDAVAVIFSQGRQGIEPDCAQYSAAQTCFQNNKNMLLPRMVIKSIICFTTFDVNSISHTKSSKLVCNEHACWEKYSLKNILLHALLANYYNTHYLKNISYFYYPSINSIHHL